MKITKKKKKENKTSKADSEASHPKDCLPILDHYVYTPWSGGEMSGYPVLRASDKLHSFVIKPRGSSRAESPHEVWRFPSDHTPRGSNDKGGIIVDRRLDASTCLAQEPIKRKIT